MNIGLRIWCDAAVYWDVRWDTTKTLKQSFDRAGLSIPFPQRDVHVIPAKEA